MLLALGVVAAPAASAEVGPFATVYDSGGAVVKRWGANYGAEPGTQIQLAENFAECGLAAGCSKPAGAPKYPRVRLEAGVYHLLTPYGKEHPIGGSGGGAGPWCEGIFAYSGVALEGPSSGTAEIGNNVASEKPCTANAALGSLSSVLYVGANPEAFTAVGAALKVSSLTITAAPPFGGPTVEYPLMAANINGANLSVSGVTVRGARQAGMLIGFESYPVEGSSASPVQIANNVVEGSGNEGIVLEGSYITAAGNTLINDKSHGVAAFGVHDRHVTIQSNTIKETQVGVSLDGSLAAFPAESTGENNAVYGNSIEKVCDGVFVFRQVDAQVAGNVVTEPYRGYRFNPPCDPGGNSAGAVVEGSCNDGIYNNRVFHFETGIEIYDNGQASVPLCGNRTTANYIGRVLEVGHPWPWTESGNWIEDMNFGFVVYSFNGRHEAVSGNEIVANAVNGALNARCYFEPGVVEVVGPGQC